MLIKKTCSLSIHNHPFVHLPIYPFIRPYTHISIAPSMYYSNHASPSMHPFICSSMDWFIYLSILLSSAHPSIVPFVHLPIHSSIHPFTHHPFNHNQSNHPSIIYHPFTYSSMHPSVLPLEHQSGASFIYPLHSSISHPA